MRKKRFHKMVGVMVSEPVYEKLVEVTDEEQITISKYVRKMIEEHLNQEGGVEI